MLANRTGRRRWKMLKRYAYAATLSSPNIYANRYIARAVQCVEINPTWGKGYARKGAALHGDHKYDEAIAAYEEGIAVEDSPALQKGLKEVKDAKGELLGSKLPRQNLNPRVESSSKSESADPFGKMFTDPAIWSKLAANPKTAPLLADPAFTNRVSMLTKAFPLP